MTALLKELKPLPPSAFFEVRGAIYKWKERGPLEWLPLTSPLLREPQGTRVSLMWREEVLFFGLLDLFPPQEGDLLELFIDTRDLKNSHVITRFCHHFLIHLAEGRGEEITRFRGEDRHPLAESSQFEVSIQQSKEGFLSALFLPKELLCGYDPEAFKRIGFAYRLKKKNGERQHFNLSSDHFHLEKHPALWASLELKEKRT